MNENLRSTLDSLRDYVNTRGLGRYVSLDLEGEYIRITLLAEGRDLWLGRRYFLISDRAEEPQAFFELNETILSTLLGLPPGTDSDSGHQTHFLFVSYSREDEPLIAAVVDLLRLTDTRVFRDRDSIRAGDKWRTAIEKAIQGSTECLVFWCSHAATSIEVRREVELALGLNKRLIPVLLDDSPLNDILRDYQAIDMRAFQPHISEVESATRSSEKATPDDLAPGSSKVPEAALAYLEKRLEELLGVAPLSRSLESGAQLPASEETNE